jgi:hypothetical protein
MSRHRQLTIVAIGVGAVLTILGCASTEDRQREARATDFNQWLGQDKQSRVRQVGPPDHCTGTQAGGGELCEWRPNGNSLRYRYDANGIARSWTYTNRQLGELERAEDQASQGGVWQSFTGWFREPKRSPGGPSQ